MTRFRRDILYERARQQDILKVHLGWISPACA
ncbi:hypothetical protein CTAM01_17302 [Colletotrichum tamarilloi]|uniref:Uncharacterized protein n=1 Tax=Colletotrichum tamarilloi TaxID=1209934 RepID=A0ABQ9QG04_9PEZI|nr:uncharacterized protein CTAM01_17302 [Colletotrichum tamarilloi]KAK1451108.1 hypothetical protein CTAM01_17302 [Colletotrichum tamarilloi]